MDFPRLTRLRTSHDGTLAFTPGGRPPLDKAHERLGIAPGKHLPALFTSTHSTPVKSIKTTFQCDHPVVKRKTLFCAYTRPVTGALSRTCTGSGTASRSGRTAVARQTAYLPPRSISSRRSATTRGKLLKIAGKLHLLYYFQA